MSVNHIIVANDKAASNPIQKMALSMGKPAGTKLDIVSVKEGIELLKSSDKQVLFIVGNVFDACEVAKSIDGLNYINYGNIEKKEGSNQFAKACFLNDEELDISRKIKEMNIQMDMKQLPNDKTDILNEKI